MEDTVLYKREFAHNSINAEYQRSIRLYNSMLLSPVDVSWTGLCTILLQVRVLYSLVDFRVRLDDSAPGQAR